MRPLKTVEQLKEELRRRGHAVPDKPLPIGRSPKAEDDLDDDGERHNRERDYIDD
jgi:hypothetical protein